MHDFADRALGEHAEGIPYGIYDVAHDEGWVSVGDVADTAEFAVESIRRWNQMGRARFPGADRLLITADAGRSNGYRLRAWKVLARLAAETGLRITVSRYPPGTQCRCLSAANYRFVDRQPWVHDAGHASVGRVI